MERNVKLDVYFLQNICLSTQNLLFFFLNSLQAKLNEQQVIALTEMWFKHMMKWVIFKLQLYQLMETVDSRFL